MITFDAFTWVAGRVFAIFATLCLAYTWRPSFALYALALYILTRD